DIDAEIILPAPGAPEGRRARFAIKGGGIAADSEAAFNYDASFADPSAGAVVAAVKATGRLAFAAAADGAINRITVRAELQAEGEGIPAAERMVVDARLVRDAGAKASFNLLVARRGPRGDETKLVEANST